MRRFSIAGLMIVTLVIALAVAALRDASDTWAGSLLGATLFLLASSLLGVLHRHGAKRAGWQGFALFGWGYLVLAMGGWFGTWMLPTTRLLDVLHARIGAASSASIDAFAVAVSPGGAAMRPPPLPQTLVVDTGSSTLSVKTTQANQYPQKQLRRVGHCLFSLLFGLVGMGVGRWFYHTNATAAS